MSGIRRGLRIEEEDEAQPVVFQKQHLDADRKRSNFQRDMDDLLFGGGPPRPVRRVQKTAEQAPKVAQTPKKVEVTKSVAPVNKAPASSPPHPSKRPNPNRAVDTTTTTTTTSTVLTSIKTIGIGSKVVEPKRNNYVAPQPEEEVEEEETIVEQPHQHHEPKVAPEQKVDCQTSIFNRPIYIRKLKKVAEDFDFAQENSNSQTVTDVIRPFECDKGRQRKNNEQDYMDYEFPPSSFSLGYALKNTQSEWKRHSQFVRSSVFGKYIDPNDINPGKLSSPQFLSILSALAQNEANIKRLIEDQKANSNGFYLIRLNINGVWRYLTVDDKLPFSNGEALGAQSFDDSESQLWPSLIQKAYAKAYSGYDIFSRNIPRENILRDLTGAPVRKYLVTDPNLPAIIRDAVFAGQTVVAAPSQAITSLGLNPNYSLCVLNCKSNGSLQFRNSWGIIQEKSKLNITKQGIFELTSNQARDNIAYIMIAYTNNAYSSSTIQSKHKTAFYSTYTFSVRNQTHGFLTVSQWDAGLFPEKAYEYSTARIILQKRASDGSNIYVNSAFSHNARNLDLEVSLLPGEYEVFVAVHWAGREYDYDLTFFGQEKVCFKRIYNDKFPNRIADVFTKINVDSGKRSALGHCQQFIQHHKDSNLVLVTADNTSDKEYLFNQDLSKVNFSTLLLLNAKSNDETYENLSGLQIEDLKSRAHENRKWPVSIAPRGQYTWIISTSEDFNDGSFKKWGFR